MGAQQIKPLPHKLQHLNLPHNHIIDAINIPNWGTKESCIGAVHSAETWDFQQHCLPLSLPLTLSPTLSSPPS